MSATNDLLTGLAADIAASGAATYRSDGTAYLTSETAITFALLPDQPNRVVTLTAYRVGGDDPQNPTGQITVQVRTRGLPDQPMDTDALDDAIYDVLQGAQRKTYGSLMVSQVLIRSSLPMGRDPSNRWERSTNYVLDVNYPPTSNRSY